MSKEKHIYNLYNIKSSVFFIIGLSMIIIFAVIYIISAVISQEAGYADFMYNNILNNVGSTVMMSLHTAVLGIGILFILIASYNISPKAKCYKDKLEVSHLFHNGHIIPYSDINDVETKVVLLHRKRPWKKDEKEVRIILKNPIYSFQFAYRTDGYFDDIVDEGRHTSASRRIYVSKETIEDIIKQIQTKSEIKMPFLPEEYKKK